MQDSGTTEQEQGDESLPGSEIGSSLRDSGMAQSLAFAAQLGFAIACPMVAFIGGGAWLDNRLHTVPWLVFAGILLGILAAAGTLYQVIRAQTNRVERNKGPRAPYKVEGQAKDLGTKSADKRGRNGR
ncbi:MAG: putative F0F1-ATPase subunit Ca2+/Mg2+ transporter [Chloroflexia bacterium]|jgi:F0F1-type ATP synthase assembly protein I|nr:putative F0F1-ATPase subunit Ca2+/Mg2+ transporter [Chloroflexia bacterium]